MQNLDPSGEYTDEEVKEALSGASGSRDWAFRYERLNEYNDFVEEVDYVQSCTIDNNSLADIKRTAKFNVLDTGTINYLKDRIKPYVRLNMPKDSTQTYDQLLTTLNPDVWWKMDEPTQSILPFQSTNNIADGTTYSTIDTAYVATLENVLVPYIDPVGGANRSEFWTKIVLDGNRAVQFDLNFYTDTGSSAFNATFELYLSSGDATSISEMELVLKRTQNGDNSFATYPFAFPRAGTYYIRWYNATGRGKVSTIFQSAVRAYDSSGKENHGVATQTFSAGTPIVRDGGRSAASGTNQITFNTDINKVVSTTTGDGISVTSWLKASTGTASQEFYTTLWSDTTQVGDYKNCDFYVLIQESTVRISYQYLNVSSNQMYSAEFESDQALPKDGKNHHITASVSPAGFSFYLDGRKVVGTVTHYGQITGNPTAFRTTWEGAWAYTFNDTDTVWDDFSLFTNGALSDSNVRDLYLKGITENDTRKGYVEWPQGVFILSSPTRTMVEGNTVVREVEAYDQLLALTEDSYDVRHTVRTGTRYTDAVKEALQTASVRSRIDLSAGVWESNLNAGSSVTYDSASTATMRTGTANQNWLNPKARDFILEGMEWSIRIDPASTSDAMTVLKIESLDPAYAGYTKAEFGLRKYTTGGTAYLQYKAPGEGYYQTALTYNPALHTYLRLRVEDGVIYYEASGDGSYWLTVFQVNNYYPVASRALPSIYVGEGAGDATMIYTDVKLYTTSAPDIDITTSTLTLPTAMEWEPGTSKLTVINDLLSAINYTSATYDENGVFVSKPYVSPSQRGAEFTYATDADSVIAGDVGQTIDLFKVPNKWILVVSNPERLMGAMIGTYVNEDPMSPTSTVSRGRTITDFRTEQDAPDQVTLDAKAERLAFEASQVYEKIKFNTGLMPIHTDSDVYNLTIDGLVIDNKYSETAWSMPLDPGALMQHEVRKITNV